MHNELQVSIITAVWNRQRDKEALLAGHMRNVARLFGQPRPIYVFDAGDSPPPWLAGQKITCSEALTIYEAWNLALAQVRTPLVMNLNLDDRLNPDAVAQMHDALSRDPEVFLVGGDWLICETEEATDAVEECTPLEHVPFHRDWPPIPGCLTRLGSGDGQRGTYGPACLWRMDAHLRFPRFPYRFIDGTPIRVIGDSIWWRMILHGLGKRAVRLPLIIGRYRTWPESQAEFRSSARDEHMRDAVSLL